MTGLDYLLFEDKFKQASFAYLTVNDNAELKKQLKIIFDDLEQNDLYFDRAIETIDRACFRASLQSKAQGLFLSLPNRINDYLKALDILIVVVNKIHNTAEFLEFSDPLEESTALQALTISERNMFIKLIRDHRYAPLLEALGLPFTNMTGELDGDPHYEFTSSVLNLINQHNMRCALKHNN